MALPTSGPLSMSAIATEFSQASSDMSLYTFGSTLPTPTVTSDIELANDFYGQSASSCTSFSGSEASREACELDPEITYYHNGSGTYPVSGDNVFTDSSCEEPLEEDSYKMANNKIMVIGEDGEVTSTFSC
tara:strand:- start:1703 stop:2095 length:393 start_codon:yes stop_codon:yes gene_type:complete